MKKDITDILKDAGYEIAFDIPAKEPIEAHPEYEFVVPKNGKWIKGKFGMNFVL